MKIHLAEAGTDARTLTLEEGSTVADLMADFDLGNVTLSRRSQDLSLGDVLQEGRVLRVKRINEDGSMKIDKKPAGAGVREDRKNAVVEGKTQSSFDEWVEDLILGITDDEEESVEIYTGSTVTVKTVTVDDEEEYPIEENQTVGELIADLGFSLSGVTVDVGSKRVRMGAKLKNGDVVTVTV